MKVKLELVYRCDHCNKAMRSNGSMALHERMCSENPKNNHKCFQYCKYLLKDKDDSDGTITFYCENTKSKYHFQDLYSYKLERFYFNKDRINKMSRMPLKCNHYQIEDGHDTYKNNR